MLFMKNQGLIAIYLMRLTIPAILDVGQKRSLDELAGTASDGSSIPRNTFANCPYPNQIRWPIEQRAAYSNQNSDNNPILI
ncbi:MAG: hypothetical protein D6160_01570 [Ketobacter sp.]|nr:MAG: hypothetical protein D6160_01570 [Ketobacter sp.]